MTEHKQVAAAIVKAMGMVKRVAKDGKNTEQKYDFASIDDFLAMVGPIMAQCGLFIHMDEGEIDSFERAGKYGPVAWVRMTFIMTVYHESGESLPPVRRTVEVIRSGAQAFGSAQSYALKQFQRALFNIPTGDKDDADYGEKGDGPVVQRPRGPSDADIAYERALTDALVAIEGCHDRDTLMDVWKGLAPAVKADPRAVAASKARADLFKAQAAPIIDDEIKF